MAVMLTEKAAEQVHRMIGERGSGIGIRIIVESSDCSGLSYRLTFVDQTEADDLTFESHGAQLFVSQKSMVWLEGTEIDYIELEEGSGFDIRNPNVTHACGCGESFYV